MATNIIKIKRSTGTAAPGSLNAGELDLQVEVELKVTMDNVYLSEIQQIQTQ